MVAVSVPDQIWEIEYLEHGGIEIEVFKSDGYIFDCNELDVLFREFGEWTSNLPKSLQNATVYTREDFFGLLKALDEDKIWYAIRRGDADETILVEVSVPGQKWEIRLSSDGSINIKKFISDGIIFDEKEIPQLLKQFE